jgi:hypothetical protein
MELELLVLLALTVFGSSVFAVFEVETAPWRKVTKWGVVVALTWLVHSRFGHLALLVPAVLGLAGVTFHLVWCRRHGIHPLRATPRRRYYELRGWGWPE